MTGRVWETPAPGVAWLPPAPATAAQLAAALPEVRAWAAAHGHDGLTWHESSQQWSTLCRCGGLMAGRERLAVEDAMLGHVRTENVREALAELHRRAS